MKNKNIAIAILARNCEDNLAANIKRIEELRKYFSSSAVFIYENNSIDRTKAILKNWQQNGDAVYLQSEDIDETAYQSNEKLGRLYRGTGEGRIRKMCDCRNKLLNIIRSYGTFDYVMFIDIDIKCFSVEGVVKSIENAPEDWGGLFANCYVTYRNGDKTFDNPLHYDTFAFLKNGKSIEQIKHSDLNPFKRIHLAKKIYREVNTSPYYKCESAFGGIGIYKGDMINGLKYEIYTPASWGKTGSTLCEHIYFNLRIRGNKYIARALNVRYNCYEIKTIKWHLLKKFPTIFNLLGLIKGIIR